MKVSTENDNNFGYEKITILVDNIPLSFLFTNSDCIFFKTFFTVLKPKETNSRVSDCYLAQTQQFSAIPWREQVNFQRHDVRLVAFL
jgi:hypothetical protein